MSVSTVKLTGNQTFNSTTPADVTGLSWSVVSGSYYEFELVFIWSTAASGTGIGLSITIPAATQFAADCRISGVAADGGGSETQGAITSSDDAVIGAQAIAADTKYTARITGIIVPSADGTLQARARNETGTTVVTVYQGSCGRLWTN
ncbi:MAG: hypothetical protein A2V88_00710 [Elusimicrobia bacterium RBG_16_66_12]|nr:MAG: hypothetical protein A2V88_00710 [Elusimicrobia bacterium RBG_16_66_12]